MKLKSGEDSGEVEEDRNLEFVKNCINSNGKCDKTELKSAGVKVQLTMGKTKDKSGEVCCVEDIVNGVQACKIGGENTVDTEITGGLAKLSVKDLDDGKDKTSAERKVGSRQEDEDSDDDDDNNVVVGPENERKVNQKSADTSDDLVRLAAPSCDEAEEETEEDREPSSTLEEAMVERGPAYGVAANCNYERDAGLNYIANKSCMSYGGLHTTGNYPIMPQNFPDYNSRNQNMLGEAMPAQCHGGKRNMEEREVYYEPQKFVRPQDAGLPGAGDMAAMMGTMNNLNAPGNSAAGKKVSSVYQKQMSGGTVITSLDNMPTTADQIMNGMTGSGVCSGDQQDFFGCRRQDSFGLHDLWELNPEEGFNIPVDVEEFLPDTGPETQPAGDQLASVAMVPGHQHSQQGPLPPVSTLTNSANYQQHYQQQFDNFPQQTQPVQSYSEAGMGKRGSFGSTTLDDMGYSSDHSPMHEMQFSPNPSPQSAMIASPATFNGSPPRTNWSPPPSNMSNASADSGVCSPMSEDHSGYHTQVKSPRQPHVMSPSYQNKSAGASPPHHQMMSPQHQMSPPHHTMSPVHQVQSPPQAVPDSPNNKCDSYITEHLDDLTDALEIANGVPKAPDMVCDERYTSRYIDDHLEDLNSALQIASADLMKHKLRPPVTSSSTGQVVKSLNDTSNIAAVSSHSMTISSSMHSAGGKVSNGVIPSQGTVVAGQAAWSGKQESVPNLPTTVPTTISPVIKSSSNSPAATSTGKGQQKGRTNVPVTTALPPGALVITTTAMHTSVNNEGKIALPRLPNKSKPAQSQMLPVIVTSNGVMAPVIVNISSQSVPPKTSQRYLPIAPKDPAKQGDKSGDVKSKPGSTGSSDPPQDKTPNGGTPSGKKSQQTTTLLNLARRLVAEMSTNDLKFKDADKDTYLHVAVCKADCYMVQALLERYQREQLLDMIDAQNCMMQTPLYLAVSTNHPEMVRLLVEHGADVHPFAESILASGAREKSAAIHCASCRGEKYLETLKALLRAQEINLNQVNSEGHTALHCAILSHGKVNTDGTRVNSIPTIQALIHAGADPNLQVQQNGKTALMYAMESRDLDLIESTFQPIEPSKLAAYLRTQAFDGSSCLKIAESFKATLDPVSQQRLLNCLKPGHSRGHLSSSPPH